MNIFIISFIRYWYYLKHTFKKGIEIMAKRSKTSSFGVSNREGHDSYSFYHRNIYNKTEIAPLENSLSEVNDPPNDLLPMREDWYNRIYHQNAENLPLMDNSIALGFTSPPYNVGKDYDDDMSMEGYLKLISNVGKEIYRVLKPGGR